MDRRIKRFNKSASSQNSKPDEILEKLDIKSGMNILEIGVGGGFFINQFADKVGKSGCVYGLDTDPVFIENLNDINRRNPNRNIKPVLYKEFNDILQITAKIDLVFTRNAYHHLTNRAEYFKVISSLLNPGSRVAIIDYNEYLFSLLRILGHFTRKEVIIREQKEAGNVLVDDVPMFKKQSFVIFRKE